MANKKPVVEPEFGDEFVVDEHFDFFETADLFYPGKSPLKNIQDFETYLLNRKFEPEKTYGVHPFEKEVSVCRFFGSKDGETILADIERKNQEQNMGNSTIPNTKIKLINYSVCPKCGAVFSFNDLMEYYKNPVPDPFYASKGLQLRDDTRIRCFECGEYFLPALVISDGTPKNEVQFLCRMQTVQGVEKFFRGKGQRVLSQNRDNITPAGKSISIRNDVLLQEMDSKPALISNVLQYTPVTLMGNLIDGSNVEKGDILFGRKWSPLSY